MIMIVKTPGSQMGSPAAAEEGGEEMGGEKQQPRLLCGQITLQMTVIILYLDNSDVYRTLSPRPEINGMHDVVFFMHDLVELSANMHLLYKLFDMHNLYMFEVQDHFYNIVAVLCIVLKIVNCAHSVFYFATQGHSMMNLRNALPV